MAGAITWKTVRVALAVVGLGTGCGSVENDSVDAPTIDAEVVIDTPVVVDTPVVDTLVARCNPTAPFGTPMPLPFNTTPTSEEAGFLTADERTIYFSSTRPGGNGGFDLWFATRADSTAAFGTPQLLGGAINSGGTERGPTVSADGLYLYASTFLNDYNVSVNRRADTGSTFGALTAVAELNVGTQDGDPYLLPDHTIYWATDDVSVGDLYRATWNGSSFRTPERMTGFDAAGTDLEAKPVVSPNELILYYQSARAGGRGGFDVWRTTRTSTVAAFGTPINIDGVNSAGNDGPSWISADDCVLYLTRNVGAVGGATDYDMFYAVRGM